MTTYSVASNPLNGIFAKVVLTDDVAARTILLKPTLQVEIFNHSKRNANLCRSFFSHCLPLRTKCSDVLLHVYEAGAKAG